MRVRTIIDSVITVLVTIVFTLSGQYLLGVVALVFALWNYYDGWSRRGNLK